MRRDLDLWRNRGLWGRDFRDRFNQDIDSIFGKFFQGPDENQTFASFTPACDVEEHADHYKISVDLPGVNKDEVKVDVVNNLLTISGERKQERKTDGRTERFYGRFERSFTLPRAADAKNIEAHFENGVLDLAVPKEETAKPQTVKIQGKDGFFGKFLGQKEAKNVKQ